MNSKQVWATSPDGEFEYISLTKEYLIKAMDMMDEAFLKHENVCKAVGLPQNPEAIKELRELTLRAARDGVSIIAVHKKSDKVVGAAFNKIQVKNDPLVGSYFENYAKSCKHSESREVVQFMIDADATCDLFDKCNVDCLMEIMFLGTDPNFRGNNIGKTLTKASLDLAKKLKNGENVKVGVEGNDKLPLEPVPKIVSAIFTTFITQRIAKQLEFEIAATLHWKDFTHNGVSYDKLIDANTPACTLEYKTLD